MTKQISDAEQEIMEIIWRMSGTARLSAIMDELKQQGKTWKPNTVLTFLSRLAEKGLLHVEKNGRNNEYTAAIAREEYQGSQATQFVADVFGGDAKSLIATLIQQSNLTDDDIDELSSFWEGKRKA